MKAFLAEFVRFNNEYRCSGKSDVEVLFDEAELNALLSGRSRGSWKAEVGNEILYLVELPIQQSQLVASAICLSELHSSKFEKHTYVRLLADALITNDLMNVAIISRIDSSPRKKTVVGADFVGSQKAIATYLILEYFSNETIFLGKPVGEQLSNITSNHTDDTILVISEDDAHTFLISALEEAEALRDE